MITRLVLSMFVLLAAWGSFRLLAADEGPARQGQFVQYGQMHEAIGKQQHQGRVHFGELTERPHFYGVAALQGLRGEATILDGKITVTTVDAKGQTRPVRDNLGDLQATMLVGGYVAAWSEHPVTKDVATDDFDEFIETAATQAGIGLKQPFVFTVAGKFEDVRLHVINGACPLHARLMKKELPKNLQPFEAELRTVEGTVVGVFAKDAVGKITHPATSTHIHLLFADPESGEQLTGHVEQLGLQAGAVVRLPK